MEGRYLAPTTTSKTHAVVPVEVELGLILGWLLVRLGQR